MNKSSPLNIIEIVSALSLPSAAQDELLNRLSGSTFNAATVDLIHFLEGEGKGELALALLRDLGQPHLEDNLDLTFEVANLLIDHAFWREAEGYAARIEALAPAKSIWIRARLALERNQSDRVQNLLFHLPSDEKWRARRLEIEARLQLQINARQPTVLIEWAKKHELPDSLCCRLYLAAGEKDIGNQLLDALLKRTLVESEVLGLAGWVMAERGVSHSEQALSFWQRALLQRPRYAACLYDRGRYRLTWNDPKGEQDLHQALDIKPWAGIVAITLANWYIRQKSLALALKVLDKTLMAHEDQPDVVAMAIDVLRMQNNKEAAIQLSNQASDRYPKHIGVALAQGTVCQQYGRINQAITAYRRAEQSGRMPAAALSNLAKMLFDEGDVDAAIVQWEQAKSLEPENILIEINLAHAKLHQNNIEEAEEHLLAVLNNPLGKADALRGLSRCFLAKGDHAAALPFAVQSLEANPNDVRGYLVHAAVLGAMGNTDAAIKSLQTGLSRVESHLPLHKEIWSILNQRRDYDAAMKAVLHAHSLAPQEIEYLLMQAETLNALNRFQDCLTVLHEAKRLDPEQGGMALIRFLESRNDYSSAKGEAKILLESNPQAIRHYGLLSEIQYREEQFNEAIETLYRGMTIDPLRVSINQQLIGQLLAQERFQEAIDAAEAFLSNAPQAPQYQLCIEAYRRAQIPEQAYLKSEEFYRRIPCVSSILAVAHQAERTGRTERTLEMLCTGLLQYPKNIRIIRALVMMYLRLERHDDALICARSLLESDFQNPELVMLASRVLIETHHVEQAETTLRLAIKRYINNQGLWGALYTLYRRMKNNEKSEIMLRKTLNRFGYSDKSFQWVIMEYVRYGQLNKARDVVDQWKIFNPMSSEPYLAALAIMEKERNASGMEAITHQILNRWPSDAEILSHCGWVFGEFWKLNLAIKHQRMALALRPNNLDYVTKLMGLMAKAGDFDEFDGLISHAEKLLGDGKYAIYPHWFFLINCHPKYSEDRIFHFQTSWGKRAVTPFLPPKRPYRNIADPERRIRIGYVSPDFRQHVVARFSEPLLICHDRIQFELYGYAQLESKQFDDYTSRFISYVHHWRDISAFTQDEFIQQIRDDEIDILVDLAGHTRGNRLGAMAEQPAPVQVSWAGGGGQSTGLSEIDYLFSDDTHIPQYFEKFCTERVERLHWTGYPYRPPEDTPTVSTSPCLDQGHITFASFSRPIRFNQEVFGTWARILKALPTAKLRLEHMAFGDAEMHTIIRDRFELCGGNPKQLVFANTRPHWNAFEAVDIVLDTFPTGSGTTTTESLWMGAPVITLQGRPMMGLFTHCQLRALKLDHLLSAKNADDYVAKALALANDLELLKNLRGSLRQRFRDSSLMNYQGYAEAVAVMYRRIWRNWCTEKNFDPAREQ
ncbi:protein O-GlcNAc transferase [Gammaproteobacteria bacterium]